MTDPKVFIYRMSTELPRSDVEENMRVAVKMMAKEGLDLRSAFPMWGEILMIFVGEKKITDSPYPPFSAENVAAGYWEIYHDDDCGGILTPYPENLCLKCGVHPDLQSRGARKTGKK